MRGGAIKGLEKSIQGRRGNWLAGIRDEKFKCVLVARSASCGLTQIITYARVTGATIAAVLLTNRGDSIQRYCGVKYLGFPVDFGSHGSHMKTAAIFLAWMAWTVVNYVALEASMKFADRCLEEMLPPLARTLSREDRKLVLRLSVLGPIGTLAAVLAYNMAREMLHDFRQGMPPVDDADSSDQAFTL